MKIDNSLQSTFNDLGNTIRDADATPSTEPPEVLPGVTDLIVTGDPGAMLAALTMQTAHEQEKTARQQRNECERAQEGAEAHEIQDLRTKADLMRVQGVVDGACQLMQAGADFGSGVEQLDATMDNLHADAIQRDSSKTAPVEVQNANNQSVDSLKTDAANSTKTSADLKASSEFLGAGQKIADGLFQGAITDKDTDAKKDDISAQAFKKMADDAHDDEKDAKALLNKALDFYKEYVDTKNQTTLAATHRA